jgi:hypothetical protein
MTFEFLIQLWNIDSPTVIQDGIEAFQNTLLCEVHLINKEPMPLFDSLEKDTIAPVEPYVIGIVLRSIAAVSVFFLMLHWVFAAE